MTKKLTKKARKTKQEKNRRVRKAKGLAKRITKIGDRFCVGVAEKLAYEQGMHGRLLERRTLISFLWDDRKHSATYGDVDAGWFSLGVEDECGALPWEVATPRLEILHEAMKL